MSQAHDVYALLSDDEKATYERRTETAGTHETDTNDTKPPEPPKPTPYGKGLFEYRTNGLFFVEKGDNGEEKETFICSKLEVIARTRDDKGNSHGRLLQWHDGTDSKLHQWAMPISLLAGDGLEVRRELMGGGLPVSPSKKARDLLSTFIQIRESHKKARCIDRLGWHSGRYVMPDRTIGGKDDDELVVFQNPHLIEPAFSESGTVKEWRDNVATLAAGNSRLTFAASVSFAGALLDVVGMEGGGFHFCGGSSKGKSTAQRLAASVWGDPDKHKRSWRATSNALEGVAALHNDGVLILDEIKEISPKDAGAAAYMLGNGIAKSRMNRNATTRRAATWKLLFLSSGEIGLGELLRQAGERTNAGQEVRMAEISIGEFENIHNYETPGKFADALRENSRKYYGAVGSEYIRLLVEKRSEQADVIQKCIDNFISNPKLVPKDASGQVVRVAKRFALVAAAGELATDFGLTGWPSGGAIAAAQKCFLSWLEYYGTGDREAAATLAQVRLFFEQNGASRFQKITDDDAKIVNRAGFCETDTVSGERTFYVFPETLKTEVLKGLNFRTAVATLIKAGWLLPDDHGKNSQNQRIAALGGKPIRVYVFNGKLWE